MAKSIFTLPTLLLTSLVCTNSNAAPLPVHEPVTIDTGRLEGAASEGVLSFKGIPYAAPPVGALRWRAPQPVKPWQGVRKATVFGHDCMQLPEPSDAAPLGAHPDEDCLVLNVWRPAAHEKNEKLPVLFWIHGGGYVNGGASAAVYDGSAFARQGIVFVSANYRLGRFGFFAHPALLAAQEGPVGNFAYMDQIAALHWIKRNIAAFGGNPDEVTLMGESAGGDSVLHLIAAPPSQGLFHRAIVMSGGGRSHLFGGFKLTGGTTQQPSADLIGVNFAASVGITSAGPAALRALRALPPETIRGDLNMSALTKQSGPPTYAKGPIIDDLLVLASPAERRVGAEANVVPLLIGTTTQDLPVLLPPSRENPLSYFGAAADAARAAYDPRGTLPPFEIYLMMGADMTMHEPARFAARQATRAGPAWLYRFGYIAESMRAKIAGAPHASEIPFFFDTLPARYGKAETERDRAAARLANQYVANFAKRGDPNASGLTSWPKVDPAQAELMLFTPDLGARFGPDPWRDRLDLLERAANATLPPKGD